MKLTRRGKDREWIFRSKYLNFTFFISRSTLFALTYSMDAYDEDDHYSVLNICLLHLYFMIRLPIKTKWGDDCDAPEYGIKWHNSTLWLHIGGDGNFGDKRKWISFYAPWSWEWVRTSYLMNNDGWVHETIGNRIKIDDSKKLSYASPYTYVLKSGEVQNRMATITVEEREWRWNWIKWLRFPRKIRRTISVDFDGEVGERSGSWKGGTIGCGYDLLPNETPLQCLRRMEINRKF